MTERAETEADTFVAVASTCDLVTGAFGNTGSVIADRLLASGRAVRTLTSRTADRHDVERFGWDQMASAFDGVDTFYNTFWMRTGNPGSAGTDYSMALRRSRRLIEAAAAAGVERIVHLSVARADDGAAAGYPYFAAKKEVEDEIRATGIPHTIVRPALIFGSGVGLVEELAFVLRRVPVMGVAGDGQYRARPVHIDDVADIIVAAGSASGDDVIDAVGPDRPTFEELVRAVAANLGKRRALLHLPTPIVLGASKVLGGVSGRELLTAGELRSTMEGLADVEGPATGTISVLDWLADPSTELS